MDFPKAIEALYATTSPNERIVLYEGRARLVVEEHLRGEGQVVVSLDWAPTPRIAFRFEAEQVTDLGAGRCTLELLDLVRSSDGWVVRSETTVGGRISRTRAVGLVDGFDHDDGAALASARFHLPNFVDYRGDPITGTADGQERNWSGRLEVSVGDWSIQIDSVPSSSRRDDEFSGGYAIEHVGRVARADGSSFNADALKDLLRALGCAFSFAGSLWSQPMLVVGETDDGGRSFEQWRVSPPRIDPDERRRDGWFARDASEEMKHFLSCFLDRWLDLDFREPLELSIAWYLEAGRGATAQASVAVAQMGLELIAWLSLVRDQGVLSPAGFTRMEAHDQLRLFLGVSGIPADSSTALPYLNAYAGSEGCDWPEVFTRIRNRTVHPPKRGSLAQVPIDPLFDASQLGRWYLELAILRFLGYEGRYRDRLHFFQTRTVPWGVGA